MPTGHKQANTRKLQLLEHSFLHVLENISDSFYVVNRNWEIVFISEKALALFNLTKEDIGKVLWERFPDAVGSRFYQEYHRAFVENTMVSFEAFSTRAHIWCEIHACPHKEHLFVYMKNVTGRVYQEKRLEFIAKATSEVIWERPLQSDKFSINAERFNLLFGYQLDANAMHHVSVWSDKIHPEDLKTVNENYFYALEHNYDFYINEYRFKKADGSWAYIKDRGYIIKDQLGRAISLIGAMEDISGKRLAELALMESESSYRQLYQNAPFPTWIYDLDTRHFLDVNKSALELYGYNREEFLNMTLFDLRPPSEYPKMIKALSKIKENTRTDVGTFIHLKKNRERLLVEVSLTTIQFKGRSAGMAMMRNVTEKVQLEQQLLQSKINQQKRVTKAVIEAQEQQRSEIAKELHDNVNQILTAAKLYVENITTLPDQSARFVQKSSELLQNAITEIRSLSKQLATPEIPALGLQSALSELIESYNEVNPFTIRFIFKITEKNMDKGLQLTIYRIIQELLNNTIKYARASKVIIKLQQSTNHIQMVYKDNGIGFNSPNKQCGQGLNNIKNRAEAYIGHVLQQTAVGKGYCITITFPIEGGRSSATKRKKGL